MCFLRCNNVLASYVRHNPSTMHRHYESTCRATSSSAARKVLTSVLHIHGCAVGGVSALSTSRSAASKSTTEVSGSSSCRHVGHVVLIANHLSMHSWWNTWRPLHGNCETVTRSSKSTRQIEHTLWSSSGQSPCSRQSVTAKQQHDNMGKEKETRHRHSPTFTRKPSQIFGIYFCCCWF